MTAIFRALTERMQPLSVKEDMRSKLRYFVSLLFTATLTLVPGSFAQQTVTFSRSDGAQTPLTVFAPSSQSCAPLAIISPGAGGTENGYRYLAEALRDRGYLAIVMGHKESGPATLRSDIRQDGIHGGLKNMVTDPTLQNSRMLDVAAALNWAEKHCHHPFKVLLGHSMGSDTVMFEAARTTSSSSTATRFKAKIDSMRTWRFRGQARVRFSAAIRGRASASLFSFSRARTTRVSNGNSERSLMTACPPGANGWA